ncbi:MAG: hypothetical protein Tsb0016_08950 [Sphingomonadales bacterium]
MKRTFLLTPVPLVAALLLTPAIALAGSHKNKGEGHHGQAMAGKGMMMLDSNKDGVISQEEFAASHDKRFSRLDADGDGKITAEEREAMRKAREEKWKQRQAAMQERREKRLAEIDSDGDGAISKAEHQAMHQARFAAMDKDGDGQISRDEMRAAMKDAHQKWRDGISDEDDE